MVPRVYVIFFNPNILPIHDNTRVKSEKVNVEVGKVKTDFKTPCKLGNTVYI